MDFSGVRLGLQGSCYQNRLWDRLWTLGNPRTSLAPWPHGATRHTFRYTGPAVFLDFVTILTPADCLVLDACVRKKGVARTGQSQAALGPRTCRKHERPAHVRLKVWHFHERMLGRNWLPVGTSGGTGGRKGREQTN
jgi:hypothetical protein